MTEDLSIAFAPLIDPAAIAALVGLAALSVFLIPGTGGAKGLRGFALLALAAALMNPVLVEKTYTQQPRTLLAVMDRSGSMEFGERKKQINQALAGLKAQAQKIPALNVEVVEAGHPQESETNLLSAVEEAFLGIPQNQRAGVVLLTDGLIHDTPLSFPDVETATPLHVLLAGNPDDHDLRLDVTNAPAYGLVGQEVLLTLALRHDGRPGDRTAYPVTLWAEKEKVQTLSAIPGTPISIPLPLSRAGTNVFEIEIPVPKGDIAPINNRIPVSIEGVRDRLRVLLVSGQPHNGGRMWRNTLTADPGIDLVHFTILRRPDSLDPTPSSEMSLIPFPFDELFDRKLKNFDLIILDRYRASAIMPNRYLENIVDSVKKGGALLVVGGPELPNPDSLAFTPLQPILPGSLIAGQNSTDSLNLSPFRPRLTEQGKAHPITRALSGIPEWGRWSLMSAMAAPQETILMRGENNLPLLMATRVEKGRVVELTSDRIWEWARGYDGGGPYMELLRPLIHWLLKEPELEEESLQTSISGGTLTATLHSLHPLPDTLTLTPPTGKEQTLNLTADAPGQASVHIDNLPPGLYTLSAGTQKKVVAIGTLDRPEDRETVATDRPLRPLVAAQKGTIIRLNQTPEPELRLTSTRRVMGGTDWIGISKAPALSITGTRQASLLPAEGWMLVLLILIVGTWVYEGRTERD